MRTMEGEVSGRAEPGFAERAPGEILQFERVGFVRVDDVDPAGEAEAVVYYTHS